MFGQNNQDIRKLIRNYGLKHWQVAYDLGINENTLSRWFRVPLSKSHKLKIIDAVKDLNKKRLKYSRNKVKTI